MSADIKAAVSLSGKVPVVSLRDYVSGRGHFYGELSLVAVRFKKRVVWTNGCTDEAEGFGETTYNLFLPTCLATTKTPRKGDSKQATSGPPPKRERQKREKELLLKTLKGQGDRTCRRNVLLHHFHRDGVLYALVHGPFPKHFERMHRDRTFYTLFSVLSKCMYQAVDLETCGLLRHLKRNRSAVASKDFWHSFYPLAIEAISADFSTLLGVPASSQLARLLHKASEKSRTIAAAWRPTLDADSSAVEFPPHDFYVCEITFETDELLGVGYRVTNGLRPEHPPERRRVTYVSPMVVSCTLNEYTDSCGQTVNAWLPFYRSPEWWHERGGFRIFVGHWKLHVADLKDILTWLSTHQSSEKYRHVFADLNILKGIFC